MKKFRAILLSSILCFSGCAVKHLDKDIYPALTDNHTTRSAIYKSIDYDYHNLPMLQEKLKKPPERIGSQYVNVFAKESKLQRAYYIDLVENDEKADLVKPAKTIVKSTGAGIVFGAYFFVAGGRGISDARILLPLLAGSVLVGGAGGLVYGTAVGTYEAVQETGKFIIKGKEVITAYADFDYDNQNRMTAMKFYSPYNNAEPLNKIVYMYNKNEEKPYRVFSVVMPGNMMTELKMK